MYLNSFFFMFTWSVTLFRCLCNLTSKICFCIGFCFIRNVHPLFYLSWYTNLQVMPIFSRITSFVDRSQRTISCDSVHKCCIVQLKMFDLLYFARGWLKIPKFTDGTYNLCGIGFTSHKRYAFMLVRSTILKAWIVFIVVSM